jgi:hypothetical protein
MHAHKSRFEKSRSCIPSDNLMTVAPTGRDGNFKWS